jgi:hypothetical protein
MVFVVLSNHETFLWQTIYPWPQGPSQTTHLHLVLMLKISVAVDALPSMLLHAMYSYIFAFTLFPSMCLIYNGSREKL